MDSQPVALRKRAHLPAPTSAAPMRRRQLAARIANPATQRRERQQIRAERPQRRITGRKVRSASDAHSSSEEQTDSSDDEDCDDEDEDEDDDKKDHENEDNESAESGAGSNATASHSDSGSVSNSAILRRLLGTPSSPRARAGTFPRTRILATGTRAAAVVRWTERSTRSSPRARTAPTVRTALRGPTHRVPPARPVPACTAWRRAPAARAAPAAAPAGSDSDSDVVLVREVAAPQHNAHPGGAANRNAARMGTNIGSVWSARDGYDYHCVGGGEVDNDDDDVVIMEPEPVQKRRRVGAAAAQPHGVATGGSGIAVGTTPRPAMGHGGGGVAGPSAGADTNVEGTESDEEVVMVGTVGTVVTRDLPHPRPVCAEYRFQSAGGEANCSYCVQCYCYVCDVKASECEFWGTGRRERDHANAQKHPAWTRLRKAWREGDKALIRQEFSASGPVRMPDIPSLINRQVMPVMPTRPPMADHLPALHALLQATMRMAEPARGGASGARMENESGRNEQNALTFPLRKVIRHSHGHQEGEVLHNGSGGASLYGTVPSDSGAVLGRWLQPVRDPRVGRRRDDTPSPPLPPRQDVALRWRSVTHLNGPPAPQQDAPTQPSGNLLPLRGPTSCRSKVPTANHRGPGTFLNNGR